MTRAGRFAGCGLVLAVVALAGCNKSDEADAGNLGGVQVDTANNLPLDGVSDGQLKQQAQALTPEQAAAAGVAVDSTIHIENLSSSDSTPAGAANNDSATQASGAAAAAPGTPPSAAKQ